MSRNLAQDMFGEASQSADRLSETRPRPAIGLAILWSMAFAGILGAAPSDPELRAELLKMGKADQEIRKQAFVPGAGKLDPVHGAKMADLDRRHSRRLKEIVENHGWPTSQAIGKDGVHAAFLIVQHAVHDPAFQKAMLPKLEESCAVGDLKGDNLALLIDRILVNEGKPQRYGTQAKLIDGKLKFDPIEDEANLTARRKQLGLMPSAVYEGMLRKMYGLKEAPKSTKP